MISIFCFFIWISFSLSVCAQEFGFDLRPDYQKGISKSALVGAKKIKDFDPGFPSSWIQKENYISTNISVESHGKKEGFKGINDSLTTEQQNILNTAEIGSIISVVVLYTSNNVITKQKEEKRVDVEYTVTPFSDAEFIGGSQQFDRFLRNIIINELSSNDKQSIQSAQFMFNINEEGAINNIRVLHSTCNAFLDDFVCKQLQKMPAWRSAKNIKGESLNQEFILSLGSLVGC